MTVHTVIKLSAVNMLLVDDDSRTPQATSTKQKRKNQLGCSYHKCNSFAQQFIQLNKKKKKTKKMHKKNFIDSLLNTNLGFVNKIKSNR